MHSHGKIDIGTNILLKYLSTDLLTATNILDIGCGCGIISLFLLFQRYVYNQQSSNKQPELSGRQAVGIWNVWWDGDRHRQG